MSLRRAFIALFSFVLVWQGDAFAARQKSRSVAFKSKPNTNLQCEAKKPCNTRLRDLLQNEGTGVLTWSTLDPLPSWLTLNTATERLEGNPGVNHAGEYRFRLAVQDQDSGDLTQIVLKVVVLPVWQTNPLNLGQLPERVPYQLDLKTVVAFEGQGGLTFTATGLPPWLSLTSAGILSGTPQRPHVGPFTGITFTATANSGGGAASVNAFGEVMKVLQKPTWTANPVVLPDAAEDFAYDQSLAGFVTNPEGKPLVFKAVNGLPGWLQLAADGKLTGTPKKPDVGNVSFTAEVSTVVDGETLANTTTVQFKVNPTNHAPRWKSDPVWLADAFTWVPYSKDLRDHVEDIDGDTLTFKVLSGPAWLVLAPNGIFAGTADRPDVGANSWIVEVSDGSLKATATVKVTVIKSNEPPKWLADPTTLPNAKEDSAYAQNLKGFVTDPDNDPLTFTKVSGPAWLTVAADGAVSGTPRGPDRGQNIFRIKVSDGKAGDATAEVRIFVEPTNHPPTWKQNPITFSVPEKTPMNKSIAGEAQDQDAGTTLRFLKLSGPSWAILSSAGVFTGTPPASALGDHTVKVRADDQEGGTADVDVIITVTNVNDPPYWTQNPIVLPNGPEKQPYVADLAPFAKDDDPGDSVTFSKVSGPAWATITPLGAFSGTPQRPDVGLNTFTVRITDKDGLTADVTVQVTVDKVNIPPKWLADPITLPDALEDSAFAATISQFAADDDNDTLTFTKVSGPAWLIVATDGKLSGTPRLADVGNYQAVFEVSDGKAAARVTANGKVLMKNYPPELNAEALSFIVKERQNFQVNLNDPKYVTDKNGDRLIFTLLENVDWVQLSSNGDLFINPRHEHLGDHNLKMKVGDGKLETQGTIFVRVIRDPRPPVWNQSPIRFTTLARTPFNATVADKVTDPDNMPLTFSKVSGPGWLTVAANGTLSGTPGDAEVGDNTFKVRATNDGASADVDVIITVNPKNHPPTIHQANLSFTVKERQTLTVKLNDPQYVEDADKDNLVFTLLDQANFANLSSNGDLFLTPVHEDIGTHQLRFRVTDGKDPVEGTLNITVLRDPQKPVWLENPIRFTTVSRKPFLKSIADKAQDPDGVALTFSKKSGPAWLTVEPNGRISGTPQDADIGINNFVVTAKNDGQEADVDLIIDVQQGNKDPFWTQNPIVLPDATAGTAYSQNVASFAGDPDNQPLTFSKVNGPDWLNVATTGQMVGTPDLTNLGLNKFTVRVSDPDGAFADTEVHVTVVKPNKPPRWTQDPVLLPDAFSDTPFTFALSSVVVDEDGDVLTFKLINGPAWMAVATDGTITGTPAVADIGDYTAVFEVSDGKAQVQAGAIGRVLRKNDPPVINQPGLTFTVKERDTLTVNLDDPQYVTDPDGDKLTFTLLDPAAWVTLTPEGVLTLKPARPHIGDHVFRFRVTDGKLPAEGTITVRVIKDPRPPEWKENPVRFTATVRQPFSATLADKIVDHDGLSLTFTKKSGPAWLTIGPGGALSGTPQDVDMGENTFVVTALNTDQMGADVTVIVDVVNDNKPPYWTQDPVRLPDAKAGVTYSQSVAGFARDPENERLTFEKVSGPAWAFLTTSGLVIGTPSDTDGGMNTLVVRVKDPHNAFADATVQIVVDAASSNHAPKWTQNPINLGSAKIDVPFSFDISSYATDEDGDALTFKLVSGPPWLFLSTQGILSGIPRAKDLGPFTAVFEVTDGKASARADGFGKVIDGTNKPPVINQEALSFIIKANTEVVVDIDDPKYVQDPEGDPLTFELLDSVDWVGLTAEGVLTMSPKTAHLGDHTFKIRVTDDKGLSSEGPLFIRVIPNPIPPKWLMDPLQYEANVNQLFTVNIANLAEDPNQLPLTFSKVSGPGWLTVSADGTLSGTPLVANLGLNNFVVRASNGSAFADVRVIINVKQSAPHEDTVRVDEAVPGAPAENLWVIDNSWPWIGQNWLISELRRHIGVFFSALNAAQIHYKNVYLSSDVQKWKGLPIRDDAGDTVIDWRDSDPVRSFRERLDATKANKCYNSPIWAMFRFYQQAPGLALWHKDFFVDSVPNDVMILTKHTDYYRKYSKGTPQANWNAVQFADEFIRFHQGTKQPYRISAVAPECPKLLDPFPDEQDVQPALDGRDNPYMTLVKKTKGTYYALDCHIKMDKILNDYAQKVIFRAYVHAKHRIPLSKQPSDPQGIKLSIGSVPIPGNTGSAQDKWFYDAAKNEVVIRWYLIDMTTIKPGDLIRIEYRT